jgi:hypothetical protein
MMARDLLDALIRQAVRKGHSVIARGETTATIIEPKRFSFLGCFILGFVPYVLWYGLVKRDKTWYVEVFEDGTALYNGKTMEEIKKQQLIENVALAFVTVIWLATCGLMCVLGPAIIGSVGSH